MEGDLHHDGGSISGSHHGSNAAAHDQPMRNHPRNPLNRPRYLLIRRIRPAIQPQSLVWAEPIQADQALSEPACIAGHNWRTTWTVEQHPKWGPHQT